MNIVEAKKLLDDAVKNERVVIFRLRNSSGKNLDVSFNGKITQVQVSENNVTIYTTNEDDLVSFDYDYINGTNGKGYSKINFNTNDICLTVNIKH